MPSLLHWDQCDASQTSKNISFHLVYIKLCRARAIYLNKMQVLSGLPKIHKPPLIFPILRICWTWRHWHLSWLLLLDFEMQWSIMTINPMSITIPKYPVELCINKCHERITREPPWSRLKWVYFNLIAYIRTFFNTYIWIWWPHTCNFIVGRPDRIINWSYTMDNSATRWRKFNKLLCGRIANVTVMFQMSITEAGIA